MDSKVRVLVVDDSVVFRSSIKGALERSPLIEIAGAANNGKIALQKLGQLSVDLVTLDMEMPEMDGIETIKEIRRLKFPVRIVVFSAQTKRGSEAALEALALGADDFLAKPEGAANLAEAEKAIADELIPKVLQFSNSPRKIRDAELRTPPKSEAPLPTKSRLSPSFLPAAIVIGSSTGGPQALQKVLSPFKAPLRCPIFIAQHMPPVFTASLAKRFQDATGIPSAEGKHEELVVPNRIYVAPGDFHMTLKKVDREIRISLDQGPPRNCVRPAVDNLFESAAKIYEQLCMAVVLTGMGEDGLQGCKAIKQHGGWVSIQEKESCVVFGMPGAVYNNHLYDDMGDLNHISELLLKMERI